MQLEIAEDNRFLPRREQRRAPRKRAIWQVLGKYANGKTFNVWTIDVSESGLSLAMPTTTPVGTKAYIKILAMIGGKKRVIECVIEIVHEVLSENTFKCGVKFLKINDTNKKLLSSYAN